jgi:hypothetical protein
MSQALLTFRTLSYDPGYRIDETLALFDDGRAALWSSAAQKLEDRHQAGTYVVSMDQSGQDEVLELSRWLVENPGDPGRGRGRGAVSENVLARFDGQEVGHSLNESYDDPLPEAYAPVKQLRARMLDAVRGSPLAVVSLNARQDVNAGRPAIYFNCQNPGKDGVVFLFDPASLGVSVRQPSGQHTVWQPGHELTMGLIGELGVLVDGLYAPAELAPGKAGRLLFPLTEALPVLEKDASYWAHLGGQIQMAGPGFESETFPSTPYELACPLSS